MKRLINKCLNPLGYEVKRIVNKHNISYYQNSYPADSMKMKRFYNIGAGGFYHPYWTNVDYISEWYASNNKKTSQGIHYDLFSKSPMPIDSNSAEVVYSSHTIEHITNAAAENMINEAFRILKSNGYLRITAPNIDLDYRAYRNNDKHFFYWTKRYSIPKEWKRAKYNKPLNVATIEQLFLSHFAASVSTLHSDGISEPIDDKELNELFNKLSFEEALDYCCAKCCMKIQKKYPGNHMNWWNPKKITSILENTGFTKIYLSGYGQSFCPILPDINIFDNTHPKLSFYIEAIK